jgi:hypothetical protein
VGRGDRSQKPLRTRKDQGDGSIGSIFMKRANSRKFYLLSIFY